MHLTSVFGYQLHGKGVPDAGASTVKMTDMVFALAEPEIGCRTQALNKKLGK